jgi:hypothetical protein
VTSDASRSWFTKFALVSFPIPYAIEHVDIVSLLKAKNKDIMAEELILLFLVTVLLVATIGTTREHMTEQVPIPTRAESYDKVVKTLTKYGPAGTFRAFDIQLKAQEDILMHDEGEDE